MRQELEEVVRVLDSNDFKKILHTRNRVGVIKVFCSFVDQSAADAWVAKYFRVFIHPRSQSSTGTRIILAV